MVYYLFGLDRPINTLAGFFIRLSYICIIVTGIYLTLHFFYDDDYAAHRIQFVEDNIITITKGSLINDALVYGQNDTHYFYLTQTYYQAIPIDGPNCPSLDPQEISTWCDQSYNIGTYKNGITQAVLDLRR